MGHRELVRAQLTKPSTLLKTNCPLELARADIILTLTLLDGNVTLRRRRRMENGEMRSCRWSDLLLYVGLNSQKLNHPEASGVTNSIVG